MLPLEILIIVILIYLCITVGLIKYITRCRGALFNETLFHAFVVFILSLFIRDIVDLPEYKNTQEVLNRWIFFLSGGLILLGMSFFYKDASLPQPDSVLDDSNSQIQTYHPRYLKRERGVLSCLILFGFIAIATQELLLGNLSSLLPILTIRLIFLFVNLGHNSSKMQQYFSILICTVYGFLVFRLCQSLFYMPSHSHFLEYQISLVGECLYILYISLGFLFALPLNISTYRPYPLKVQRFSFALFLLLIGGFKFFYFHHST